VTHADEKLCMCVCVCVRARACICAHVHTCTPVHTCVHGCMCERVHCSSVYTHVSSSSYTHVSSSSCALFKCRHVICVCACVYLCNASYGFTYLRSARAPHEGVGRLKGSKGEKMSGRKRQGRGGEGGAPDGGDRRRGGPDHPWPTLRFGCQRSRRKCSFPVIAARQCFTAKALLLSFSLSLCPFCRPPVMPRMEGEFAKRASAVELLQSRYGR